MPEDKL